MAFGKKLSIDLTNENQIKLEKNKKESRSPYGSTINNLIKTFCDLPEEMRSDMIAFCESKIQFLCQQMDIAKGYELERTTLLAEKYIDIITFLKGTTVSIETIKSKPKMSTIAIKGGTVIFPDDWIVINPNTANFFSNAGVVECREACGLRAPHFLFFTNETQKFSKLEIERINMLCAKASPIFEKILKLQVHLIEDPDHPGKYLNEKEFLNSPQIGHFFLYVQDDPSYLSEYEPPYGARIIRHEN